MNGIQLERLGQIMAVLRHPPEIVPMQMHVMVKPRGINQPHPNPLALFNAQVLGGRVGFAIDGEKIGFDVHPG